MLSLAAILPLSMLLSSDFLTSETSLAVAKPGVDQFIVDLENSNSSLLQYPSQFTQGIVPKQIHSHNDYWRDVPLFEALSFGVASVEADVWFINDTLFIGHELAALTPARTFDSLYIQPIMQVLAKENPKTAFTANQTTPNGVFDTSSTTPLQLLVDMKTDGDSTLPPVLSALQPLREAGYLTTFANGTFIKKALLVIGTGNTPLAGVQALEPRDFFFDAPLTELNDTTNATWSPTLSPIASTDYGSAVGWSGIGNISDSQREAIVALVNQAKELGIPSRFWDTPGWPIHARDAVWRELLDAGASWLNADDLEAAANF